MFFERIQEQLILKNSWSFFLFAKNSKKSVEKKKNKDGIFSFMKNFFFQFHLKKENIKVISIIYLYNYKFFI